MRAIGFWRAFVVGIAALTAAGTMIIVAVTGVEWLLLGEREAHTLGLVLDGLSHRWPQTLGVLALTSAIFALPHRKANRDKA